MSKENSFISNHVIAVIFCLITLFGWWHPYFINGWLPLSEWGGGLIWGDWLSDRLFFLKDGIVPEWNPNNVFGVNYIGRDPFNNPLSLGNIFKFLFSDPKAEWIFGLFFYLTILSLGTFKLLIEYGVSKKYAILGSALIVVYPKWIDDIYHGPGKFVTAYSMLPFILLTIKRMFDKGPSLNNYISLGLLAAISFLGSGALVCVIISYLIIPFYIYGIIKYLLNVESSKRIKILVKNSVGSLLSLSIAVGLSSYLLLPLLDNIELTERSLFSPPNGYGIIDILGMFMPWSTKLYTTGYYDLPLSLPFFGVVKNFRSYFGILAIPILFYFMKNKNFRKKFIFFGIWIVITAFLFSKPANIFFPLISIFERFLGAQSSENFQFFGFIFCFNILLVAGINHVMSIDKQIHDELSIKKLDKFITLIMIIYSFIMIIFLLCWVGTHYFTGIFDLLLSFPIFNDLKNVLGIQLLFYSYFYTSFFYLIGISFLVRFFILYVMKLEMHNKKKYRDILLFLLLAIDFLLIPKLIYPFTSSLNLRYSDTMTQNVFVKEKVKKFERTAGSPISIKKTLKIKDIGKAIKEKYSNKRTWNPAEVHKIVSDLNKDNGFYQPLFDPGLSYYAATIGKQTYNYHESLLPDYFYDFDEAMNKNSRFYYRSSWNALYDPNSKLVDVAGIKYLFWPEPIDNPKFKLVGRYKIGDGFIYLNSKALPKAYLVSNIELINERKKLLDRLQEKNFNIKKTITTEDQNLFEKFKLLKKSIEPFSGKLKIIHYSANKIVINVDVNNPGVIVVTDLFFPYWSATVNNKDASIYRVNSVFRGIILDKGNHKIEMSYYNKPFHKGLKITIFTVLLITSFYLFNFIKSSFVYYKKNLNSLN